VAKAADEPLEPVLIRLYREDAEYLRSAYGSSVGLTSVVRLVVRTYVRQLRARTARAIDAQASLANLDLDPATLEAIVAETKEQTDE
jgi:hypothetical protein